MNKAQLDGQWQYLKMILGNAKRQIELIPEDKFDFRPTPDVRNVAELCTHMHVYITELPESVAAGKHIETTPPAFTSKANLLKWTDSQVQKGSAIVEKLTDQQLSATVNAWGQDFPGWKLIGFVFDDVIHHRGQLTVYQRLLGIEPVFIYDFGD